MTEWPEPRDDPIEEPGEHRHTHLLPSLSRLQRMTHEQREELLALVEHWEGPHVARFRARVIRMRGL